MRIADGLMVVVGIAGLIGVRVVEDRIFYDPFLEYFHEAGTHAVFPDFDWWKLISGCFFRFGLNLLFSLVIVFFLFKRKDWTVQAAVLICMVFAITFPLYLYCISTKFEVGYLISFYLRRFVIQPLVVLLIIPMFYYRKQLQKS
ncbi:exosortase F system-associated protein [Weeksellaceae bacterium A-14]|uniref:exosortase F system-associated membrane protein n=1 Tax=Daejeonia sp. YH14 TaxID=3439042 RepID=UPI0031E4C88B